MRAVCFFLCQFVNAFFFCALVQVVWTRQCCSSFIVNICACLFLFCLFANLCSSLSLQHLEIQAA